MVEPYVGKHFMHNPKFINVQTGRAIGNRRQYGFFYCPEDANPWSVQFCGGGACFSLQAPLGMGFPRQEY